MSRERQAKLIPQYQKTFAPFSLSIDEDTFNIIEESTSAKDFNVSLIKAAQGGGLRLMSQELPIKVYQDTLKLEAEVIDMEANMQASILLEYQLGFDC